jgi:hypothetical protein
MNSMGYKLNLKMNKNQLKKASLFSVNAACLLLNNDLKGKGNKN